MQRNSKRYVTVVLPIVMIGLYGEWKHKVTGYGRKHNDQITKGNVWATGTEERDKQSLTK